MNHSGSIKELAAALSKAQAQLKHAAFDSRNPHFKNRYASLSSCIDAVRAPLADNALSYAQTTKISDQGSVLVTTLMHASGEWISGEMPLLVTKNDMQGLGTAITYARRYGLSAIVGMTQDDDDGNGSEGESSPDAQLASKIEAIIRFFSSLGITKYDIQKKFNIKSLEELTNDHVDQLIEIGKKMKLGQINKTEFLHFKAKGST